MPKGYRHNHRGIIGIEAAIVLIAFVIVAAALAFVALNMGFSTTQKSKTTITSSLGTAGSSMVISGKVLASSELRDNALNITAIPIKVASGGDPVALKETITSIKYLAPNITYDDIYAGTLNPGERRNLRVATADALTAGYIDNDPYVDFLHPTATAAFIYWSTNENNNDYLDSGEHAVVAIVYAENERPLPLEKFLVEIVVSGGASLSIERQVPLISTEVVDLG